MSEKKDITTVSPEEIRAELIEQAEKLYKDESRIRKYSVTQVRPDDYAIINKSLRSAAWVYSPRHHVMDCIVEGEEILAPVIRYEDYLFSVMDTVKNHIEQNGECVNLHLLFSKYKDRDGFSIVLIDCPK